MILKTARHVRCAFKTQPRCLYHGRGSLVRRGGPAECRRADECGSVYPLVYPRTLNKEVVVLWRRRLRGSVDWHQVPDCCNGFLSRSEVEFELVCNRNVELVDACSARKQWPGRLRLLARDRIQHTEGYGLQRRFVEARQFLTAGDKAGRTERANGAVLDADW